MAVGAAALVALSAAFAAAGWLALVAIVLAGMLRAAETRPRLMREQSEPRSVARRWLFRGVTVVARTSMIALFASAFAAYLFEESAALAVVVFLLFVAVAEVADVRVNTYYRRWLAGVALVGALVFVGVCLSISPVEGMRQAETGGVGGLLPAVAASTVLFTGVRLPASTVARSVLRLGTAVGAVLVVAAAAAYQIGPIRLGLSSTPLREVLVAAEAGALLPLLAVVVVLTTAPAALQECRGLREAFPEREDGRRERAGLVLPSVVAAGVLAVLLDPLGCLLVAAALGLARTLLRAVAAARQDGGALPPVVGVAAASLLVGLALAAL